MPMPVSNITIWKNKNGSCLRQLLFLIPLIFGPFFAHSQAKDTLYFFNKTKVVGELIKIRLGRIEFDADNVGIISIKNTKIESMHATSRSFRLETYEGEEVQGYLLRSNKPGRVIVHSVVESRELLIEDIVNLIYYGKTLESRLVGNFSAGYTYTKSSRIGRINTAGLVKYNTSRGQTQLNGDMIITYDSVSTYTERANLSFGHEHNLGPLWGAIGILKYQRNLELGLERRWQEAFGLGREFLINKRQQAMIMSGVAFNQERNEEDAQVSTTEAMFQAKYDLFSFAKPNMTVSFVESAYVSLTEQDRVRLDGDISFDYEIIADFSVNFQFYHNFDSRSPATGTPNIDYGFVAGIKYEF